MSEINETQEIQKKVIAAVKDSTGKIVAPSSDFVKDEKFDSITRMELLMQLEDAFGIEIPDNDAANLTSIDAVTEYIIQKHKERKP